MGLFGLPYIHELKAKNNVRGLIKALQYRNEASIRKAAKEALVGFGAPSVEPISAAL
jgi:hypothetical protein